MPEARRCGKMCRPSSNTDDSRRGTREKPLVPMVTKPRWSFKYCICLSGILFYEFYGYFIRFIMYIAFFFHREAQYGTLWGTICEMREIITDDFKNPGQIRDKNATCEIKNTRFEIKKKMWKNWSLYFASFSTARLCTGGLISVGVRWTLNL